MTRKGKKRATAPRRAAPAQPSVANVVRVAQAIATIQNRVGVITTRIDTMDVEYERLENELDVLEKKRLELKREFDQVS